MAGGWIKLYRNIQDHWIWQDPEKLKWWLDILLLANHQDNKFLLGNELMVVERGEHHTSEIKLAERWNVSKTTVRKFLKLLENDKMIETKKSKKGTTLKVCNYNDYQDISEDEKTDKKPYKNHKKTIEEPLKNHKVYTNKNDKECIKNDKNEKKYINLTFIDEVVDNVHISQEQYDKLLVKFGMELTHKNIIALDNYIANNTKGKGYKDHYRALNTWCSKDTSEGKKQQKAYGKKESNFNNFEQRDYDFEDLERKLLGWDKEG